jgi:hypothetical protein
MTEPFEDRYFDVLQDIESVIVSVDRQYPETNDQHVKKVLDALIRSYEVEARGYSLPTPKFTPPTKVLYDNLRLICDWRLGKELLTDEDSRPLELTGGQKTIKEIIACLKRIRLSIKMHKSGGQRGYLNFVSQFIG